MVAVDWMITLKLKQASAVLGVRLIWATSQRKGF
jgi:hypothetical protein